MRVTFFQKCPQGANFSIERLFGDVRRALPDSIDDRVAVSRFPSRGIWRRVYNVIEAAFHQGDVNHITGDVHFLTYLLNKKRTVLTILDCVTLERLHGIRKKVFLLLWYWLPEKRSKIITVISKSTKRELLRYINCDPEKIRVIPCCISEDIKPTPYTFNTRKPRILQVGTGKNKNILLLAEALKSSHCHLRIIGKLSDEQIETLKKFHIEYSSVANISDREIVKEYQKSDMLVFVSTYEGFGLPILEAQVTGRPVVTSNILSMPEVAGESACLVNPFDVQSIRAGILKVIEDREYRDSLVERGLRNAQRFNPTNIAHQYAEIYEELFRNGPGN